VSKHSDSLVSSIQLLSVESRHLACQPSNVWWHHETLIPSGLHGSKILDAVFLCYCKRLQNLWVRPRNFPHGYCYRTRMTTGMSTWVCVVPSRLAVLTRELCSLLDEIIRCMRNCNGRDLETKNNSMKLPSVVADSRSCSQEVYPSFVEPEDFLPWEFRFSGRWVRRWLSSGMLRPVHWYKFTDVSEALTASIFCSMSSLMREAVSAFEISVFNRLHGAASHHWTLSLGTINPAHTYTSCCLKILFSVIFPPLLTCLFVSFGLFGRKFCMHFLSPQYVLHALPSSSTFISLTNNIWWKTEIMQIHTTHLSPFSCYFLLLRSN
jgi:hypothetical protein